jgi:hypothetical protein
MAKNKKLFSSANSDFDSKQETAKSRFNEKIIDEARRLREEASELEKQDPSQSYDVDYTPISEVGGKLFGQEFVSRFPTSKAQNASISLVENAKTANSLLSNEIRNSSDLPYISVLIDREVVKTPSEIFISRMSENVVRNVQETAIIESTTFAARSLNLSTSETTSVKPTNQMIVNIESRIKEMIVELLATTGEMYEESKFPRPSPRTILPSCIETCTIKKKGTNGDLFSLNSVDSVLESYKADFSLKTLVRTTLFFLTFDVEKSIIRNQDDVKFLEVATASFILDCFDKSDLLENLEILSYLKDFEYRIYFIADWLQYKVNEKLPTDTELQKLISGKAEAISSSTEVDILTLWRLATLDRLSSSTPEALDTRSFLWEIGLVTPAAAQNVFVATAEANFDAPATEKGLLGRLNDYLDQQLVTARIDLNEARAARGKSDDTAAAPTVTLGQGQDLILESLKAKGTLSPAMLALRAALNSTQTQEETSVGKPVRAPEGVTGNTDVIVSANSAASRLEIDLSNIITPEELSEVSKMSSTELKEFFGESEISSLLQLYDTLGAAETINDERGSAAEAFISNYFDGPSKIRGKVLSKDGAGRFQAELLKDLFTVSSVKVSQGAYIFDGTFKTKTSQEFVDKLEQKFRASRMADELGYSVMMNVRYPNSEDLPQQQALDQMLGETPSVVVFPTSWNSSIGFYGNSVLKKALSAAALVSCGGFAANCFGMFNTGSAFMTRGEIPGDLIPLALVPLLIQYVSTSVESAAARQRGFDLSSAVLPSFSLFNFGSRTIFTSMPKNRNDVFDTTAIGIAVALTGSLILLFIGLQITATSAPDVVASYPTVSLSLLDTNAIVKQLMSYEFPAVFKPLSEARAATNMIYGGDGAGGGDAQVHLHWLAIAGAVSFIGNTLQLFPLDSSAGSKMSMTVVGKNNFIFFGVFFGALKALFVLPMLFNMTATGVVTTARLLTDYFLTSTVLGIGQVKRCSVVSYFSCQSTIYYKFNEKAVACMLMSHAVTSL